MEACQAKGVDYLALSREVDPFLDVSRCAEFSFQLVS